MQSSQEEVRRREEKQCVCKGKQNSIGKAQPRKKQGKLAAKEKKITHTRYSVTYILQQAIAATN